MEARPASVTGPARCWGLGIRAGSPTSTPSGTTRVDRASGSAPERVHRARRSLSTRLANAIDLPDLRLGDEPLARANHLPFSGQVVAPCHAVRQGPASSAHGHPPVRFRLMVVVELAARLRCACRRHTAPIGRHSGLGLAAPQKGPIPHPGGAGCSLAPPYAFLITGVASERVSVSERQRAGGSGRLGGVGCRSRRYHHQLPRPRHSWFMVKQ